MIQPYFKRNGATLYTADSFDLLKQLPENSVEACVTDPPYELTQAKRTNPPPEGAGPYSRHRVGVNGDHRPVGGFMGKQWDGTGIAFSMEFWALVLRTLKPGAHLLAFGGTRTHHRMVCAIEDAGFEIRDEIDWVYGQGFPKSLNFDGEWDGYGTALKPSKEPICLARKPLIGTVAANLAAHGTGAINIDGCRIEHSEDLSSNGDGAALDTAGQGWGFKRVARDGQLGRWPANFIHDGSPEVMALFPDSAGQLTDARNDGAPKNNRIFGAMNHRSKDEPSADSDNEGSVGFKMKPGARRGDAGSAARFFYSPKTSKKDREEGLDRYEIITAQCSAWENADQKATLLVDTAQSPPRVIDVYGAPNNSASEWSMFLFGSRSLALSLTGSKSIIRTKTSSTTSSKTLSFFLTSLTSGYTVDADGSGKCAGSHAESADDSSAPMIITSGAVVSVHGAALAASPTQWRISARDACPLATAPELVDRDEGSSGMNSPRAGSGRTSSGRRNTHPTIKPTELMRYLCRLITPPGGTIIDPFMGSGSTGKAALLEGFEFIGIEKEELYAQIARARVGSVRKILDLD